MASIVLTNAYVLINSVDLSDHVQSVKINYKADTPENTAMSNTTKARLPGLKDWDLDIEFNQDYALSKVDATLFPLVGASAFAVEVRPDAGARSTTNPGYTGNALLSSYDPVSGKVGEVAKASVKLIGTGAMARQTA